jgi:DNA topoisomerase-3
VKDVLLTPRPRQISDSLYQKGYLSYPRTETDQFDKDFDFDEMIQKHVSDGAWGVFATK